MALCRRAGAVRTRLHPALFGSASIAYFNKLGGRFILPLYVPLMALPVIVADGLVQAAKRAGRRTLAYVLTIAGALVVTGLGVTVLRTTYPVVMESHARGMAGGENSFNNESWRENPAIRYWEGHTPTRRVPALQQRAGWSCVPHATRGASRAAPCQRTVWNRRDACGSLPRGAIRPRPGRVSDLDRAELI